MELNLAFWRRSRAPNEQLRRTFANHRLPAETERAVLEVRDEIRGGRLSPTSSEHYRDELERRSGRDLNEFKSRHPNLFPSLLAEGREVPRLQGGSFDLSGLRQNQIRYQNHQGRTYGVVETSLKQVVPDRLRTAQIASDYAADDLSMRLRVPLDAGVDYSRLPLPQQRQKLQQAIEQNPRVTGFVHGFQSTAAIWDSSALRWMEHGGVPAVGIAFDGYGTDGSARSDGRAPYTPKQYGFQLLEGLDAMGLLDKPLLDLVGHSMGGAAVGEMAVALQKAGYQNQARFFMLAPAATPDSTPFFEPCKDPVNGTVVGKVYVPAGSSELLGPLVQWVDEKAPFLSRTVVNSPLFLDLGESDPAIRAGFADYYRELDHDRNMARRDRANENMQGMLVQQGLTAAALERVAAQGNFEVHLYSFGKDRLVDPREVAELDSPATDYHPFPEGSHTALFADPYLNQILKP